MWSVKNSGFQTFLNLQSRQDAPLFAEDVLAQVGKEFITREDLDFEKLLLSKSLDLELSTHALLKQVKDLDTDILYSIVERKILYTDLLKDRSFDTSDQKRWATCTYLWEQSLPALKDLSEAHQQRLKTRLCEKSLIEQYCHEKIYKKIAFTEEQLLAYFKTHAERFQVPEKVRIRQILTFTEAEARWVQQQLNASNFSAMARKYSTSPEGAEGGKLPPYQKGELPQIFDTAFTLKIGKVEGIFKSTYGYHLFIVDEKNPAKQQTFSESRAKAQELLLAEKQNEEFKEWLEHASQSTHLKIFKLSST